MSDAGVGVESSKAKVGTAMTARYVPGIGLAVAAALHKMLYASVLVNDDFMHRVYALQLLAGDRPVGDFFDYGMGLMYGLSAASQAIFGYRLLSEAVLIALMVGVSTFLVYELVHRATRSTPAAILAAILLVVAMPRGYGYPKLIVYAAAAALWWGYVWKPGVARALGLGVWTAVAFYWRPDHGLYVAAGSTLAFVAAHGWSATLVTRCLLSGLLTIALVTPWLVFASLQMGGFDRFVRSGILAAVQEHREGQSLARWPLWRPRDVLSVDPPELYAPTVGVRWTRDSSRAMRERIMQEYGLTVVSTRDEVSQQVRLSKPAAADVRALVAESIVEDTDGIDRGAARVSPDVWPRSRRWRFEHWWLRLRILPALDAQVEAGEAAALLLFAVPLMAMLAAVALTRHLPPTVRPAHLIGFGLFAWFVDIGMLRSPFHVRVGDAVVLPGVLLGLLVVIVLAATHSLLPWRRRLVRAALAVFLLVVMKSLGVAGLSAERIHWIAGDWSSLDSARGASEEVAGRLSSSPPIEYWRRRNPEDTLRLAAYAHDCLSPSDRILVLWFAPEIYYYSDRLMAGRHLHFLPEFGALLHERQMELDKIRRTPPQIVFSRSGFEGAARRAFPEAMDVIASGYHVAGSLGGSDRFQILVRNDRTPVRSYGDDQWPCYR